MKKKQPSKSIDINKDTNFDKSSHFTFAMNESLTGQDNSMLDTSCKVLLEESLITQKGI